METTSAQNSLLKCYKLSDYSVEPWLTDLLKTTTNADFKEKVQQVKLIQDLVEHCKDFDGNLEGLEALCKSHLKTEKTSIVTQVLFLQSFTLRENSLGPSVYTEYVEDTRAPLVKSGELPENDLDPISYKNKKLQ